MKTDWIKHRSIVAAYYRSANAYAALCRRNNLSSERMNPVEIQIIEQLIDHSDENWNMKWYAQQIGISTSAFTNTVNEMVKNGLVEKYHTTDNKKNIILKVSERGLSAYEEYSTLMLPVFAPIFEALEVIPEKYFADISRVLNVWADQHLVGVQKDKKFELLPVK